MQILSALLIYFAVIQLYDAALTALPSPVGCALPQTTNGKNLIRNSGIKGTSKWKECLNFCSDKKPEYIALHRNRPRCFCIPAAKYKKINFLSKTTCVRRDQNSKGEWVWKWKWRYAVVYNVSQHWGTVTPRTTRRSLLVGTKMTVKSKIRKPIYGQISTTQGYHTIWTIKTGATRLSSKHQSHTIETYRSSTSYKTMTFIKLTSNTDHNNIRPTTSSPRHAVGCGTCHDYHDHHTNFTTSETNTTNSSFHYENSNLGINGNESQGTNLYVGTDLSHDRATKVKQNIKSVENSAVPVAAGVGGGLAFILILIIGLIIGHRRYNIFKMKSDLEPNNTHRYNNPAYSRQETTNRYSEIDIVQTPNQYENSNLPQHESEIYYSEVAKESSAEEKAENVYYEPQTAYGDSGEASLSVVSPRGGLRDSTGDASIYFLADEVKDDLVVVDNDLYGT